MPQLKPARLPPWIRVPLQTDNRYVDIHKLIKSRKLHTVCESAACPNRHTCWNDGTATFMILGDVCTRNCRFCAVRSGIPDDPPQDEIQRVVESVKILNLKHVVVTSVTRDDLPDGGAGVFASLIRGLRELNVSIEVLIPDFRGDTASIRTVVDQSPDVLNHNLETVARLQPGIRPQASYETSLSVLRLAADNLENGFVKSGLMLGLGETEQELRQAFEDLLAASCDILTLGQYLPPSHNHYPVSRYVSPDEFFQYGEIALEMGFKAVASEPLVRSSFQAAGLLEDARKIYREKDL